MINGGSATGNSFLYITNAGGPGDETTANGIRVVQAINGGTTAGISSLHLKRVIAQAECRA
ncbi:hypothetical protein [Bradyrhizobium retamae]|uniref:hypothetical protein n=1 Tax=Bradyrhizobium retamae TaxID=1300035 RepID=UPI0024BFF7DE|nr:hypothetical protein [Bradyrhizobium retamae]